MDAFLVIYIWSAIVLYMSLSISLIVKFITYRTVDVPQNRTGFKFGEFAGFTCDTEQCSFIKLTTSGDCKLKCTVTEKCNCYHSSPLFPGACFLYKDCDDMVPIPSDNNVLKLFFGIHDRGTLEGPIAT